MSAFNANEEDGRAVGATIVLCAVVTLSRAVGRS